MVHVFQMFNFLEPSIKAMDSVGYFVRNVLPIHQRNLISHNRYCANECTTAGTLECSIARFR
ncbi:7994_t:CDS:1, partial [Racocetra persica]